jgi:DNA-directed RNA polymerase subunit RPC12/RpoP
MGYRSQFADPGGRSALRASSRTNPRIYPCPTCEAPNRLTQKDVNRHYQCDACADRDEGFGL